MSYRIHIINRLAVIIFIFICLHTQQAYTFVNFGMNKPHMLFHLGDRRPVSTNIGWGYWADSQPMKLKYQNTRDDLYANMVIHDGERLFQEHIDDRKSNISTQIRYQLNQDQWQSQIVMENPDAESVTWFTYVSVENNDYRLVDHQRHTSYIQLIPSYSNKDSKNQAQVRCRSLLYPNQTLSIKQQKINDLGSQSQVKFFGIAANISQTYTIYQMSQAFKRLVRVQRGQETLKLYNQTKSQQKKLLQWQYKQVQLIKQNNWVGKSYVVLFTYGTLKKGEKTKIVVTNSTKDKNNGFDHQIFKQKSQKISDLYKKNIQNESDQRKEFVKHVISNLYGGMTFYFGRLYTQNSLTVHKQDYSYSFTPSRLIFPRSFLWDDGFHQSVVVHYSPEIVIDVLTNWMNKIDIFGWIGREQIRGGQISSMMPDSRFVFQDWFEMNPPTLMLSLISLIKKCQGNDVLNERLNLFFINYYRRLEMWYRYFKNTQSHQSLDYDQSTNSTDRFFRWHCKDQCSKGNFMGSGLDDYPRRGNQTEIAKQHVDLLSWLYLFSKSLAYIGQYMEQSTQRQINFKVELKGQIKSRNKYTRRVKYYKKQSQNYVHQLYDKFYDKSDQLFKDIVVVNNELYIQKFVDKIGYINLFPFFTGMLSQQKNHQSSQFVQYNERRVSSLKRCLQIMSDQKLLMSKDGLRSLSFSDSLYGTDDNYWRGAVWLPINFMVLRACKLYYWNDSVLENEIKQFYSNLRQRLINSVYNTYKQTGYLYQNYYQGHGHRGFPFYGWTSTIVNIITQQY